MIGYVAKDKDDILYLYSEKPEYDKEYEQWSGGPGYFNITGLFPEFDDMYYTDEPIKVEINIKIV